MIARLDRAPASRRLSPLARARADALHQHLPGRSRLPEGTEGDGQAAQVLDDLARVALPPPVVQRAAAGHRGPASSSPCWTSRTPSALQRGHRARGSPARPTRRPPGRASAGPPPGSRTCTSTGTSPGTAGARSPAGLRRRPPPGAPTRAPPGGCRAPQPSRSLAARYWPVGAGVRAPRRAPGSARRAAGTRPRCSSASVSMPPGEAGDRPQQPEPRLAVGPLVDGQQADVEELLEGVQRVGAVRQEADTASRSKSPPKAPSWRKTYCRSGLEHPVAPGHRGVQRPVPLGHAAAGRRPARGRRRAGSAALRGRRSSSVPPPARSPAAARRAAGRSRRHAPGRPRSGRSPGRTIRARSTNRLTAAACAGSGPVTDRGATGLELPGHVQRPAGRGEHADGRRGRPAPATTSDAAGSCSRLSRTRSAGAVREERDDVRRGPAGRRAARGGRRASST